MNAYLPASVADLWSIAGWTMVHFLWLGALIGAAAAVCRLVLRRASANVRYACMIAWLIALVALPMGTAAWLGRHSPPLKGGAGGGMVATTAPSTTAVSLPSGSGLSQPIIELHNRADDAVTPSDITSESAVAPLATRPAAVSEPSPSPSLIGMGISLAALEACIPYLPWFWLIGTPITFLLLVTGVVGTRRLGRASQIIIDGPIAAILAGLTDSLRITRRVTVAVCERIASPVLIGIVRPMILLPPAALTGWSPDEIEMVLLHELAHVRRWDNLINLLQRCVESLLFFHPAVWLVSSWVRREREACCDAVVVGRTNRPHAYAEMLVALAAQMPRSVLFHPVASNAMAAGPLRSRIRRILQVEDDPMLVSGKSLVLMLGSLLVAATLVVLYVPTIGQAEESTTEGTESTEQKKNKKEAEKAESKQHDLRDYPEFQAKTIKQAWEKWGLRVEPATDTDVQATRYSSALKLVGVGAEEFPAGTPQPMVLESIDDGRLITFEDLSNTLDTTLRQKPQCKVITPDGPFVVEFERNPGSRAKVIRIGRIASNEASTERSSQENESITNMKKIMLAILNYEAVTRTLPPQAICDASGRPLLSWRVLILPYLNEAALFNEFRLDEPWDSEHNRKLIARMPAALANPMLNMPGKTNYLAVVGSECAFDGSPNGLGLQSISDGTANTIDVIEADFDQAVEWTKPQDWNFERNNPTKGLGATWPDGWHAAYVDGHIRKFARDAAPNTVGIAFTRGGGEQKSLAESAGRSAAVEGEIAGAEGAPAAVAADNDESWLDDSNFVYPRDQRIARKAWEMLGHKIGPVVTPDLKDAYSVGYKGGLKDLSYKMSESPALRNKLTILVALNNKQIRGFDDLDTTLAELYRSGKRDVVASLLIGQTSVRVVLDVRPVADGEKTVRSVIESEMPMVFDGPPRTPEDMASHKASAGEEKPIAKPDDGRVIRTRAEIELEFRGAQVKKGIDYRHYDNDTVIRDMVKWAFTASDSNPLQERLYSPEAVETEKLQEIIALPGWEPSFTFTVRNVTDKQVVITTTKLGHELLCAGLKEKDALTEMPPLAPVATSVQAATGEAYGVWRHSDEIQIKLTKGDAGTLYHLNDLPITEDSLRALITRQLKNQSELAVTLAAEKVVDYAEVIKAMKLIESLGVKHIQLGPVREPVAVGVTELKSQDAWPMGVAFPSPKEGNISTQAWKQLGIKVVPASRDEQAAEGGHALKVVGGVDPPPGVKTPVFLLSLNHHETKDFDGLAATLKAVSGQKIVIAKCANTSSLGRVFIETALDGSDKPAQTAAEAPAAQQAPAATTATDTPATADTNGTIKDRVFAEFSRSVMDADPQKFLSAIAEAKKKKLYLDMEDRGDDKVALVITFAPKEADWPAMLGEPPRKERVIAEQARQRLGLMLASLNQVEAMYQANVNGVEGLQIVGGNVPNGLPLPAILTSINGQQVSNFDQLLSWLENEQGGSPVKCHATADGKQYLFDAGPSIDKVTTKIASRMATEQNRAQAQFPSLDDQKLFDLAWKRLGLELEAISGEELRRVQALGYEGGVKVAQTNGSLEPNDILVGLHVWPTTSIKDVATILGRDDLAELNPLKFYVIRQEGATSRENPNGVKDFVRSGRITLQLESGSRGRWGGDSYNAPSRSQRPSTNAPSTTSSTAPRRTADPWSSDPYAVTPDSAPSATFAESAAAGATTAPASRPLSRDPLPAQKEHSVLSDAKPRTPAAPAEVPGIAVGESPPPLLIPSSPSATTLAVDPMTRVPHKATAPKVAQTAPVPPTPANAAELEVFRERVQVVGEQFKKTEALWKTGSRGGSTAQYLSTGYELALAEGELALAEGKRDAAIEKFRQARTRADEALKANRAEYLADKITYDILLLATRNVADIKLRLIRLQGDASAERSGTIPTSAVPQNDPATTPVQPGARHPNNVPPPMSREPGTKPLSTFTERGTTTTDLTPSQPPKSADPPPAKGERSVFASNPAGPIARPIDVPKGDATQNYNAFLAEVNKSNLRYDGKTYETWRDTWRTELSTQKRYEAIRALAAFGRAGYGKEATETILDIAAEYDFKILEGHQNPEGELQETVFEELAPESRTQSLAPYWLPDLAARLKKDPAKWKWLTYWVVSKLRSSDAAMRGILQEMAAHDDADVKTAAFYALLRTAAIADTRLDDKTRKLVNDALGGKDPVALRSIIQLLVYTPPATEDGKFPRRKLLYRPPGLALLLLRSEPEVRLEARAMVPLIDEKDAPELVSQLVDALKDPSRETEHIAAMRALALMGPKAAKAFPALFDVLKNSKNEETFAAAIVALVRIADEPSQISSADGRLTAFNLTAFTDMVKARLSEEDQLAVHKKLQGTGGNYVQKFMERLTQEDNDLLPPPNQGGGGFGGGGGFF